MCAMSRVRIAFESSKAFARQTNARLTHSHAEVYAALRETATRLLALSAGLADALQAAGKVLS